jgi:uncharacterized LabA/DUF88 family protein
MIFIDGSNLFHACKAFRQEFKIDYKKLRDALTAGRKLIRTYYYGSFNPENEEVRDRQMRFYHALEEEGFHVFKKPLRKRSKSLIEKGIDIALAVDMLALGFQKAYDVAIIVSGDGDFTPAVEVIKSLGLRVEVAIFRNAINPDLRRIADKFIPLDELADEIEKK